MRKKQLTFGALLSYGAIVFNIAAGLLYTPWMIRTIGDDQYALYTLALSVVNLFLLDFGIGGAVSKFLSNYYAKGQLAEADRFMGIVYKVFFLISTAIALCLAVFYFCIDSVYVKLTAAELVTFKHLFLIVAVHSVLTFPFTTFNGILMANERFIAVKACNFGQKVLSVAMIVAALLLDAGVYVLVLAHAVSNVIFLAIKYACIRKGTSLRADLSCRDRKTAVSLFKFSAGITVINLAQRFVFNIMPTLIAALIGSVQVTVFSLAATLESYVYSFADAINGMFLPKISRILQKETAKEELSSLMIRVGRFHVFTIGLLFLGFLCVGQHFVFLWMGEGYELVYWGGLLLIFPSLIDVPQQVARTALLAKDIVKPQAIIYVGMAVANIVLSLLLIPTVGILGAAVSICFSYLLRTAAFNLLYRKHLGISLKTYFFRTYLRWLPAAAGTTAAGLALDRFLPIGGWWGLLIKIIAICAVYAVLCFAIVFTKEERNTIKKHNPLGRNSNV